MYIRTSHSPPSLITHPIKVNNEQPKKIGKRKDIQLEVSKDQGQRLYRDLRFKTNQRKSIK